MSTLVDEYSHVLLQFAWPLHRLGEAMEALAAHSHLPVNPASDFVGKGPEKIEADQFNYWMEATALWIGIEVEQAEVRYAEINRLLQYGAPMFIRLRFDEDANFLCVLDKHGRDLRVVDQTNGGIL